MMSCACGRNCMGNSRWYIGLCRGEAFASPRRSAAICGLTDDVAQVSMTSLSGRSSAFPHIHGRGGASVSGSTGSCASSAKIVAPQASQCHSGNGTP